MRDLSLILEQVLFLSVYFIGIYGLMKSQSMVRGLMCLELILNLVNRNLVTFSDIFGSQQLKGEIFSIIVIAIATAEATIGLAIILSIHHNRKSIYINQLKLLNN